MAGITRRVQLLKTAAWHNNLKLPCVMVRIYHCPSRKGSINKQQSVRDMLFFIDCKEVLWVILANKIKTRHICKCSLFCKVVSFMHGVGSVMAFFPLSQIGSWCKSESNKDKNESLQMANCMHTNIPANSNCLFGSIAWIITFKRKHIIRNKWMLTSLKSNRGENT